MTIAQCLIAGPITPLRRRLRVPNRLPRRRHFARVAFLIPGTTYHCPAPTSRWFECRRPLPCTSHGMLSALEAVAEHGFVVVPTRYRR